MSWPVQDAKARFSELLDIVIAEGAQIVTRRGVETVAIVPIEQWRRLGQAPKSWIDILLAPEPRVNLDPHLPRRRDLRPRVRPVDLE